MVSTDKEISDVVKEKAKKSNLIGRIEDFILKHPFTTAFLSAGLGVSGGYSLSRLFPPENEGKIDAHFLGLIAAMTLIFGLYLNEYSKVELRSRELTANTKSRIKPLPSPEEMREKVLYKVWSDDIWGGTPLEDEGLLFCYHEYPENRKAIDRVVRELGAEEHFKQIYQEFKAREYPTPN